MKKRVQFHITKTASELLDSVLASANNGFEGGNITYADVLNEMIISSKVEIKALQLKHTDLRRSLRVLAGKSDVDLDMVLKKLTELKAQSPKKKLKNTNTEAVV